MRFISFSRLPIKDKFRLVMVAISVTGLVMAVLAFYLNDLLMIRRNTLRDAAALTTVVGKDVTVALAFRDAVAAADTLSALRDQPNVMKVCVFDKARNVFASYTRADFNDSECRFSENGAIHLLHGHYMVLVRPLIMDNEDFGTISIRYSLEAIVVQLKYYSVMSVVILIIAILVVYYFSYRLSDLISSPILSLTQTASQISAEGDYSIRADRQSDDEIGVLVDGFNAMLSEIEARDETLALQNMLLEEKVKERTRELQQRNREIESTNKRLEQALQHAETMAREAETASRYKSQFLANVSHEIRTPLNIILGFAEILEDRVRDEKERQYAASIQGSGRTLLTLINDILDLSKIEAGKLELAFTAVDVADIVNEISQMFGDTIRAKGLSLSIRIDAGLPKALLLDEVRLRQVLFNIMGNAVKFTDKGSITLSAEAGERNESTIDLILSVADTGIGIAGHLQEEIFDAFQQQPGHGSKYGGTGLGLAITQRLVQMMNGTVGLESEPGNGATFSVVLKGVTVVDSQAQTPVSLQAPAQERRFQPANILLVDDQPQNRILLKAFLNDQPLVIYEVDDGPGAMEISRLNKIDLILLDMKLSVMDSFETARSLKRIPSLSAVPIVAVTASVMEPSLHRLEEVGCDGYLKKPVRKQDLYDELARFLHFIPGGLDNSPDSNPDPKAECSSGQSTALVQEG